MSAKYALGTAFPKDVIARIMARRETLHIYLDLDPHRTALIVIDMQVAFLQEGSIVGLKSARDIVPAINRLARGVRLTGGRVVWITSTYGPDEKDHWPVLLGDIFTNDAARSLKLSLCLGSDGHALWPALEVEPEDLRETKNRSSAFLGSNGRLASTLRAHGIETVLIAGTMTSVCCESSAREAAMLDFKTIIVADANAGRSPEEDLATFTTFIQSFGDVASSDDVIARLNRGALCYAGGQ